MLRKNQKQTCQKKKKTKHSNQRNTAKSNLNVMLNVGNYMIKNNEKDMFRVLRENDS